MTNAKLTNVYSITANGSFMGAFADRMFLDIKWFNGKPVSMEARLSPTTADQAAVEFAEAQLDAVDLIAARLLGKCIRRKVYVGCMAYSKPGADDMVIIADD